MEKFTLHDQHVHSHYSADSCQPIIPYLNKARELNCRYFITTDHIDFSLGPDWDIDVKSYLEEIKQLQDKYPDIKILKGVEVGYFKKNYKTIKSHYQDIDLDVINLSVHFKDDIDYYNPYYFKKYGLENTLNIYFENILEAITNFDDFQVLSHIDYGFKTAYLYDSTVKIEDYKDILVKIFKVLIAKNKALEINTKVQSFLPVEHTIYLLNLYHETGGRKLTLSSDAHQLEFYRYRFEKYQKIIKDCGFNYLCYFIKKEEYHYPI